MKLLHTQGLQLNWNNKERAAVAEMRNYLRTSGVKCMQEVLSKNSKY